ncbi:zincin-like metallopeptidase domain-containing protein [Marinomonas flavescens]|uniref:zincin-like metallopeptidase domain-containing protein n=1 Tax=Marinomonas flavescens TaxID=2529379 RepID=UPI001A9E4CC8
MPKTEEDDGDRAYYTKALDKIVMPDRELFKGTKTSTETEAYYAVLLHELTHWTGIKSRRDRDMSGRFGEASYAMEELVAELGSAFACAQLGVTNSPRQDHADYIASWINVLEKDPKSVFWASARASEAVAYLDSVQP